MSRRRLEVLLALLLGLVLALEGFRYLNGPVRDLEGTLVLWVLRLGRHATLVSDHTFQLLPPDQEAFRAQLTPYCSSVVALLALAAIALFVLSGSWPRRLLGLGAAIALVLGCNVLRIALSLFMGYHFGGGALVLFHDWVGTFFALTYTMAGFFLMLYLILPSSSARIARAARVSDVL